MDTFPVVLVPLKSVQINVNGRVHKFDPPSMDNVNEYITLQKAETKPSVEMDVDWMYLFKQSM